MIIRCLQPPSSCAHIAVGLFEQFPEWKLSDILEVEARRGVKPPSCVGGGVPEHDHLRGGTRACARASSESLEPHSKLVLQSGGMPYSYCRVYATRATRAVYLTHYRT